MKRNLLLFTLACIFTTLLYSCQSSRKAVAYKPSKQPKFIDNVCIAPHNKSNATANAITPKKAPQHTDITASSDNYIYTVSYKEPPRDEEGTLPRDIKRKYAEILNVRPKEISNYFLFEFIDKWYGTIYRLGGCDISGIDCSGFVQKLYAEVYGIDLLRTSIEQFRNCKRVKKSRDAEEGDLVFFHTHGKRISHVGVYLTNDYFIHASTSNGVIISNLNDEYWHKHYSGCGRIPKNAYTMK